VIRALFFDCFEVLYIRADQLYFSKFPAIYDELHDLNKQADHGFIDRQTYITAVSKLTGVGETETVRAFSQEYMLNRPLISYIQHDLKPNYKIGLLTNIGRGWIQDFFDEHQLNGFFDEVIISSQEGITKPNPLIFERAAEHLGLSPDECVMIDDRQENCEGARAAGMKALKFIDLLALKRDLEGLLKGDA
jgi:HAD superfamily hydrolase (TIGR01509 family)